MSNKKLKFTDLAQGDLVLGPGLAPNLVHERHPAPPLVLVPRVGKAHGLALAVVALELVLKAAIRYDQYNNK